MRSGRRCLAVPVVAVCWVTAALCPMAQAALTTRVSVASDGREANGDSGASGGGSEKMTAVSANGQYVAFVSWATNLVEQETKGKSDIFVRDRLNEVTERVSVDSFGKEADGDSRYPAISANGRYVAFQSEATNLVAGDGNNAYDVFVRDRMAETTELVSVDSFGNPGNAESRSPAISANGRYVAFCSEASNLVSGDTEGKLDIFVHDRVTGTTTRVSVATSGEANGDSYAPAISADGRYVAFHSWASNLVATDANDVGDVFVYDRAMGTTELVSVATDGKQGWDDAMFPALSADGQYVAFHSWSRLTDNDGNNAYDVFVHDRMTGITELVSVTPKGGPGFYESRYPSLSGDGRYVAFDSWAGNLVPGDGNGYGDVFVRDRVTGITELASVANDGTQGDFASYRPALSEDGGYVAFVSKATTLVPGDANGRLDVFVRDRVTKPASDPTIRVSVVSYSGEEADGNSDLPTVSADGRYVAFASFARNLDPTFPDTNGCFDIFVYDRDIGATKRVSVTTSGKEANKYSYSPAISADGEHVAFESSATNLVSNDTNGKRDIFLHDRVSAYTGLVSVAIGGAEANGNSSSPAISAEGRYVAFRSDASNLVSGDTRGKSDIFVRDRLNGTTERVSVGIGGAEANGDSSSPAVSADGRYVAFASSASNLASGDTKGKSDIFVRDRTNGTTERVSVATGGAEADGDSAYPAISADGSCVAFQSNATNLVARDENGKTDVFVHNLATGSTGRVSVGSSGSPGNGASYRSSISKDGRYVAFQSAAANLVPLDRNGVSDIFLRDRLPVTKFSASPYRGHVPLNVKFSDESVNAPTAWCWTFGDGGSTTVRNPSHTYTTVGRYTVSLTAWSADGTDTEAKHNCITVSFTDVPIRPANPSDYWALDRILDCFTAGIVGGYADGSYRPALPVTRDAMAVFISRALAGGDALVPAGPCVTTFTDVSTTHWAFKYVEHAYSQGVAGGYPDGTYLPALTVTRDQMAVFIARAMCGGESGVPAGPGSASFSDVSTTHWAFRYVEYLRSEGVSGGYPDGTYRPTWPVTRDQMAVYVQRAFELSM